MPNILLITADDLNYNSIGYTGCKVDDISPNLDKLASEGMYFSNAHVSIAVCQPSCSSLMTGKMPHRNGARGFDPIDISVATLTEQTRAHGYINGIIGKLSHLAPKEKFCWDYYKRVRVKETQMGRNPEAYYNSTVEFLKNANDESKPFFLMVNSHDPHRPFAGSEQEMEIYGTNYPCNKVYKASEIEVPGFLPDIPKVREELAQYYSSVHRCDETIGKVLKALKESGHEEDTVVFFLSDNGMAFPYAKTNCYLTSTKTPLIVRWPNVIKPSVNDTAMVSGVDFMPTVLEILDLPKIDDLDGHSYKDILLGISKKDASFDDVFTVFNTTAGRRDFPMRCVMNSEFGYIFNAWSDGTMDFENESQSGITFDAMVKAGKFDSAIKDRVDFFVYRTKEELYNLKEDPDALNNLANDARYKNTKCVMQERLLQYMEETCDFMYDEIVEQIAKM